MAALLALVEGALSARDFAGDDIPVLSYRIARREAEREASSWDILCLGDSLIKQGLLPRVLEARLGRPAYNLAQVGAQPPATYHALRHALESGARPSAVIIDFKATIVETNFELGNPCQLELMGMLDRFEVALAACSLSLLERMTLNLVLPSYRDRRLIRERVVKALTGVGLPGLETTKAAFLRNWEVNRGAQVAHPKEAVADGVANWDDLVYLQPFWSCHRVNEAYIRRLLALARSRGIRVFWVIPPIHPRNQARREEIGTDRDYTRFVRLWQERFPDLTVIDGRRSGFPSSRYIDGAHLDAVGAEALSEGVADALAGLPAGERWARLPDYHEPAPGGPVEDHLQSAIAVEQAARGIVR
jgi:hypothetical protein